MKVQFVKLRDTARLPVLATEGSVGYDLYWAPLPEERGVDIHLAPGETRCVQTGLIVQLPAEHYAMVCSRSGLAKNLSVNVLNAPGIIDSDYRGEIGVILHNHGTTPVVLPGNKAIAQLVFAPAVRLTPAEIAIGELQTTDRGSGGFGSTSK